MPEHSSAPAEEGIGRIVGARLTSVQFVLDYLILGFDEKGALTTLVWPELRNHGTVVSFGEPSYRNDLCGLIHEHVVQAALDDDETINITFSGGANIRIPLRTYKHTGERAILTGPHRYLRTW
jgi:hypothetical protein